MSICLKLTDLLSGSAPPPPGGWLNDLGPEPFAALDENGDVFVIGYKGEWFHRLKPSLRVRLHNWLVRRTNPK